MSVEIKVPALGESITEATVAKWLKSAGDAVNADEPVVELETDKVALEVPAPVAGVLSEITAREGDDVEVGAVLGSIAEGDAPAKTEVARSDTTAEAKPEAAGSDGTGPAARKLIDEHGLDPADIDGTGPKGNITKGDVLGAIDAAKQKAAQPALQASAPPPPAERPDREERVKMTRLRKRIAERLKEAQNTAAMLTTYNEVDMSAVMALRRRYQDSFTKKHGIKLGFMSFFVKAVIEALRITPAVNAEIDGDEVVYKHFYDIGVAVGTPSGLVVPVVRDADQLAFAEVEKAIGELGVKARDGKLSMADLTGGTFTISNGGVYGSLMSSPILNPPQSGILGMHKIQQRPMVMPNGNIKARPMMYLALSYDHRVIDGREAVTFLVRVKECIEDPERILLDV